MKSWFGHPINDCIVTAVDQRNTHDFFRSNYITAVTEANVYAGIILCTLYLHLSLAGCVHRIIPVKLLIYSKYMYDSPI